MRVPGFALVVAAVAATAACSSPSPDPSASPFTDVIEDYLEMAQADRAADEQIEVLEEALSTGEVTIEQIVDLSTREVDCLTTAGFTVRETGMEEILAGSGIEMPGFLVNEPDGMDEVAASAVADDCHNKYLSFAQAVYMSNPKVLNQYYAVWDTPEIRQCLIDHGYDVDDDTTARELNLLVGEDVQDHMGVSGYSACDS